MKTIPAEDKTKKRIRASGTLPNGVPVVVNKDGSVSAVSNDTQMITNTSMVETSGQSTYSDADYDSHNDRIVVAWKDPTGGDQYGAAIVGEVKGNTIVWGTKVFFNSAQTEYISVTFFSGSHNKMFIAYKNDGDSAKGWGIVGTVDPSDNSITFGTAQKFNDITNTHYINTVYTGNDKAVIVFTHSTQVFAKIVTITGTTPGYGSQTVVLGSEVYATSISYDTVNSRIWFAYQYTQSLNSGKIGVRAGTIDGSGNLIVSNTEAAVTGTSTCTITKWGLTFQPANNINTNMQKGVNVLAFKDQGQSNKGFLFCWSTNSSWSATGSNLDGGAVLTEFHSAAVGDISIGYNIHTSSLSIAYYDAVSSTVKLVEGKISSNYIVSINTAKMVDLGTHARIAPIYVPDTKGMVLVYSAYGGMAYVFQRFQKDELGSPVTFEGGDTSHIKAAYSAHTKRIVVAYRDGDDGSKGKVVIGQVNDMTVTFGSPQTFLNASTSEVGGVACIPFTNRIVVAFEPSTSPAVSAIPGIINPVDNTVSFGSTANISGVSAGGSLTICPFSNISNGETNTFIVGYDTNDGTAGGYTAVGMLNAAGDGITFGAASIFNTGDSINVQLQYSPTYNRAVVFYRNDSNSNYGTARILRANGTSIFYDSGAVVFNTQNSTQLMDVTLDTPDPSPNSNSPRFQVAYWSSTNSGYGYIADCYIHSTLDAMTFYTGKEYQTTDLSDGVQQGNTPSNTKISYNEDAEVTVVSYLYKTNKYVYRLCTNKSGTFGNPHYNSNSTSRKTAINTIADSSSSLENDIVYDQEAKRTVLLYRDVNDDDKGKAIVLKVGKSTLTSDNYIGISTDGAVTDGMTATVDIIGTVNENQSGLTPGKKYYIQKNGSLTTNPGYASVNYDDTEVLAGTALSATKLLVKK
jgi:hypothetical protein